MPPPPSCLSFVFPMWNEEAMIMRTVAAAREAGERLVRDDRVTTFEIVLVDDASTDATGKIADELAVEDPRIEVVHHAQNRTLGGALTSGFAAATGDAAATIAPFDAQSRLESLTAGDRARTGAAVVVRLAGPFSWTWALSSSTGETIPVIAPVGFGVHEMLAVVT